MQAKLQQDDDNKVEIQKQLEQIEREYTKLEGQRDSAEKEKRQAVLEIDKLHMLIEEMDKSIQLEQQKLRDQISDDQQRDDQIRDLEEEKEALQQQINEKDNQM